MNINISLLTFETLFHFEISVPPNMGFPKQLSLFA